MQLHPKETGLTRWQAPQWHLRVGRGESVPDIELFQAVLQFWTDFIHANHIACRQPGPAPETVDSAGRERLR